MSNSTDRYRNSYGVTGSYIEQGDLHDAREARQQARRQAWKSCRGHDAINIAILLLGFIGMAAVMGYGLVGMVTGR